MSGRRRAVGTDDDGSAVVDFVLVGTLATLLFVALVQLALTLHVRNTTKWHTEFGGFRERAEVGQWTDSRTTCYWP